MQLPPLFLRCSQWLMAWLLFGCVSMVSLAQGTGNVDATALAKAAVARSTLPDPGGKIARSLADAVRALPPWAPFYPAAALGMDSSSRGPGMVQVGFATRDSPDQVAHFYVERFKVRAKPIELREHGVRTIEVSNAKGDQITSVILQPRSGGGVVGVIKHEGGGY